jgi:transcription-repair coupling factor (superfamily II helicase)
MEETAKKDRTACPKRLARISNGLKKNGIFPELTGISTYMADEPFSLLDYAGRDVMVFIDEPERHGQRLENLMLEHEEICKAMIEKGSCCRKAPVCFLVSTSFWQAEKRKTFFLNSLDAGKPVLNGTKAFEIPARTIGSFQGNINLLEEPLPGGKRTKSRVLLLSGTKGRGERLRDTLVVQGNRGVICRRSD